jgi:ABC-type sulfate transport system permease component
MAPATIASRSPRNARRKAPALSPRASAAARVIVAGNIPGRTQTLSLAIFSEIQLGDSGAALRLVAITVGFAFVSMWSVERLLQNRSDREVSP